MSGPVLTGAARLSVAPVGTDPSDTDAWAPLGLADVTGYVTDKPEPPSLYERLRQSMADLLPPPSEWSWHTSATFELPERPYAEIPGYGEVRVNPSPMVPRGNAYIGADFALGGRSMVMTVNSLDFRPATAADYAGVEARRVVRHGMAEILEWLGEEVGPHPSEPIGPMYVFGASFLPVAPPPRSWVTINGV